MAFLSTPITYALMRFCLFLEWTGLCQGSWVVALIQRKITKWKRDEVYVGTAEERAALKAQKQKDGMDPTYNQSDALDKDGDYNVHAGHLYPGVPTLPHDFVHRNLHTLDEIEELESELLERQNEIEERLAGLQHEKEKLLASRARVALLKATSGEEMDA
jgi:cell division protein FtsB